MEDLNNKVFILSENIRKLVHSFEREHNCQVIFTSPENHTNKFHLIAIIPLSKLSNPTV